MTRSAQDIWEAVLGELQLSVNKANFNTWLKPTKGILYHNRLFIVSVPNQFIGEWLEKRWLALIKKTLVSLLGHDTEVKFQVGPGNSPITMPIDLAHTPENIVTNPPGTIRNTPPPFLNKYTFDNFIVSAGNRLAHANCWSVAHNQSMTFNPLFIFSGTGLGKTHLLHAIGHAVWGRGRNVLYSNGEKFTNEFINSLRHHTIEEFLLKYRSPDILLMDDVQFLSGKAQTQEIFFNTFNDLYQSNHQIVLSCDRPPKSLPFLEDKLRSRFEWGIIVDIIPPDSEARMAILKSKLEGFQLSFPDDILGVISEVPFNNVRELEGCLNKVVAHSRMSNQAPTLEMANKAIKEITHQNINSLKLSPQKILEQVAHHFEINHQSILNKKRDRKTVFFKHLLIYLIREECSLSLADIGDFLGYKDHTSILYGYEKVAAALKNDEDLKKSIDKITQELHSSPHN